MIYIDSDGVIADFHKWVMSHYDELPHKEIDKVYDIDYLMLKYYNEVFLICEPCKHARPYLEILERYPDSKILTAVPNPERLKKEFPEDTDIDFKVNVMKENKYKWFENIGVSRDRVIIANKSSIKSNYCNSPKDILFDDRYLNIKRWREAGGIGILVNN